MKGSMLASVGLGEELGLRPLLCLVGFFVTASSRGGSAEGGADALRSVVPIPPARLAP
eukprot:CAMPEP_0114249720 /NCGR_PEP_ID=MMETSP0058-20121206/14304_1 /TAXON_ID=36894 /ORGANISM="Pyramimonas parkeae, CCMP726" /LENGTH=57 /DNA_ID=CAMNT_0001363307 /DNA_START=377 /DNA_END=550 /DNA_ORIENTATION=-